MAYSIAIGSVLQVTFESKVLNQQMLTVLAYRLEEPTAIADGAAALNLIWSEISAAGKLLNRYAQCASASMLGLKTKLQWISPNRYAYKSFESVAYAGGLVGADLLAPNVAFTINKRTDSPGPSGHGVTHMPGVPNTFAVNGELSGAGLTAYNALMVQMSLPITVASISATLKPMTFHRALPTAGKLITSMTVDFQARTMHRRTVGLGS